MKKLIYSFLAIDIVIFAFLAMNGGLSAPKYDLKPAAFNQAIQEGKGKLIDVRTVEEYENARIPNSTLVNWKATDFKDRIQQFDKNEPIYIYCRTGMRAARAQRAMKKMGFKEVYNLTGGIKAWAKEGLPVKSKPGYNINDNNGEEGC